MEHFPSFLSLEWCFMWKGTQKSDCFTTTVTRLGRLVVSSCREPQFPSGVFNNSLQGYIPNELGRLSRLLVLVLGRNKFDGGIPTNLSNCSNLRELSAYS
ncbi:protein kinase-like domain-containing protein [Artemisia annua]|uniref:Protein kinase-like domain-containing protein n=1 Tax=Artemisia annua TaxID=35608 RepID=A0A2U1PRG9_ARTAN|nr:protein kinase-like domain-containing protein [Artemisia annua]